jgi:hypothetical protein
MTPAPAIKFISFPQTQPPPPFSRAVVEVFRKNFEAISTDLRPHGLTSDAALRLLAPDLMELGFQVETGKTKTSKIDRPVFFGEEGEPTLNYQIDGYHPLWRCGIEVEAGRAWMGNAIYRDLIQASLMVDVDHLCLAVAKTYKYESNKRPATSEDYTKTLEVVSALYGHSRVKLPFGLTLIGY